MVHLLFSMQTVAQRIMMECVECELALKTQNGCIEDYTKSSVEVLILFLELYSDEGTQMSSKWW